VVPCGLSVAPEDRYPSMDALLAALAADPGRARRRRLAGLGALVLAGAALAGAERAPEVCRGDARALAGVWDAERAQAFRTMIAYSGRYRVEGSTITTKVEVAWNESWVGGEQVRHIRFEGDRLFIESPPMPHPNMYGKTVRVIVVWQRDGSYRV